MFILKSMPKKTLLDFRKMKTSSEQITWVTAYSYPLAYAAERAGVDMILIGDSGGMVELGYSTTNPVTMDEMIQFAKAVRRGAPNTFLVGDMPQASYEISNEEAIRNAMRFIKEAGCDAIKLEGGARVAERIRAIVNAGILVVGHLGLTPQSTASFGGYRVQGKTRESFEETLSDSINIEHAGICMLLLEAMPSEVAGQVATKLHIPVLGIGAGNMLDGQLIIMHDLLGFYPTFRPWFAKCYVPDIIDEFVSSIRVDDIKKYGITTRDDGLGNIAYLAIRNYVNDVRAKKFPSSEYIYPIKEDDLKNIKASSVWNTKI
jgi:3-methyl-2-oxobutanoate hydroxymethyltransferase